MSASSATQPNLSSFSDIRVSGVFGARKPGRPQFESRRSRDGYPIHERGITYHPGLYFVGLPWLHNAKSGLLFGLAQDAEHIAVAIDEGSLTSLDGSGRETYYLPPAVVRSQEVNNELSVSHS